jgi:ATP-binding cassette subfamily F protein 3
VANYPGDYQAYLYRVHKEIEQGMREAGPAAPRPVDATRPTLGERRSGGREGASSDGMRGGGPGRAAGNRSAAAQRERRKQLANLERKIERLSAEKQSLSDRLLATTDAIEAQRLYDQVLALEKSVLAAEEKWLALQEEA